MSFPRYPAYKPSGVEWLGEVPEHWGIIEARREIAFLTSGSRGWAEYYSDDGPIFLRIGNLTRDGIRIDLEDIQRVNPPAGVEGDRTEASQGDVLFSITAYLGSVAVVPHGLERAYVSQHVCLARLRKHSLIPEWLAYSVLSASGKAYLESESYGGTKVQLALDDIKSFPLSLPPVEEQRSLIAFLDRETAKIDALIAEQQRLIELLQEKRQAVIFQAVTKGLNPDVPMKDSGVEWLGEVPEHWAVKPLKYLVTLASGGTPSKDNLAYWDGSIPWASSKDLKADELFDTQDHISQKAIDDGVATLIPAGSILTVVRGMILRHTFPVAIARVTMATNQDLKVIRPSSQVASGYLAWLLRGSSGEVLSRVDEAGHGTKVLRIDWWLAMMVPVPPVAEQHLIAESLIKHLQDTSALTEEAHRAVSLLQERRSAVISAAVTGQLDVRGLAPEADAA